MLATTSGMMQEDLFLAQDPRRCACDFQAHIKKSSEDASKILCQLSPFIILYRFLLKKDAPPSGPQWPFVAPVTGVGVVPRWLNDTGLVVAHAFDGVMGVTEITEGAVTQVPAWADSLGGFSHGKPWKAMEAR